MKIASKVLLGISAALTAAYLIVSIVQAANYNHYFNSAPVFVVFIVNAFYFLFPAVILAAVVMLLRKKTCLLIICAAVGTALAAFTIYTGVCSGADIVSAALLAAPAMISAAVCAVFAVKSKRRGKI